MSEVLTPETIELKANLSSQEEAIRRAGTLLVGNGHVEEGALWMWKSRGE